MKQRLYFDLETGPREEGIEIMLGAKPFDPSEVKTGNLKDPEKIAAKIEEARAAHEDGIRDKAALNPSTAEILCVQVALGDDPVTVYDGDERDMLERFWAITTASNKLVNWVGNNSSGNFDLNMLCRRSWAHGLRVPIDLPELVKGGELCSRMCRYADWNSYLKLETAARELGIEVQDTIVTGKDFHKWWKGEAGVGTPDEQRKAAMEYAVQDVRLVREIDKRIS